jgi:hypothetical protein
MNAAASPGEPALQDWIRQHLVSYEVSPHVEMRRREKMESGFEVALHAMRSGPCTTDPGCPSCQEIHRALSLILRRAVPDGVQYDVAPFDASFHLRPETQWEPEVELTAWIRPLRGEVASAAPTDLRSLGDIRAALDRLGVRAGRWSRS